MIRRMTAAASSIAHRALVSDSFTQKVISTLLTQGFLLAVSVVSSAITARLLGTQGKGLVAMVSLVQGLMVLVFNFGIGSANVQFAGSRRHSISSLSSNSLGFAVAITAIAVPLLAGTMAFGWLQSVIPRVPLRFIVLGVIGFPIVLLGFYFSCILQGIQRISQINVANLVQGILSVAMIVVLVLGLRWGVLGAILAAVAGAIAGLILKAYYLRREGASLRPAFHVPAIRQMLGFGLRGYAGNLLQFFNYRFDVFVVNWFLGPAAVGIYSAAVTLAELLWQLPQAASYVIFPRAAAESVSRMNRFTPRVLAIALAITAAAAAGLAIAGPLIIHLIYSDRFAGAYMPLLALLPGVVLLGGGKILTSDIAGRGHPEYNSYTSGMVVLITIGLTLWLVPRYGILGASIASTVAYATAFAASLLIYRRVSRRGALDDRVVAAADVHEKLAREEGAV